MPGPRLIADPDVIRTGTGAPLVLAHGAGGSVGLNFGQVIDTLSTTRTLIGMNYPGSGATPPDPAALELPVLADAVVRTAIDAGFERFPILGLSLGTALAATGNRRALAAYLVSLSAPAVLGSLDRAGADAAVAATLENYPYGGADQARLAATVDIVDTCHEIAVPTVVFAAGQDRIVLPETTRRLATEIPGATLIEYPDAGHIFTPDEAAVWIADIDEFLRKHHL